MIRRLVYALRYAVREQDFDRVLGAAAALVIVGTLAYTLGEGWSVLDGFYVAVATQTIAQLLRRTSGRRRDLPHRLQDRFAGPRQRA